MVAAMVPPDDDDAGALVEVAEVELRRVPRAAGGFGAIASTTGFLWRETGLRRGARALLALNQPEGFDCPGCAWPEAPPAERHRLEFCENGAKAIAEEATTRRATPALFAAHAIEDLRGRSDFELGQLGRLTHPMIREAGDRHYREIGWDDAFARIGAELRALGPAATALYTSGRTSNEAAFLYQLVGRRFGTSNFPDCANLCHESSGVAMKEAIGVGKGTVSLADFAEADLIVVLGQNPGTNHPRMLSTLREAARRGATIVAINPLREPGLVRFAHPQKPLDLLRGGVALARTHVPVRIGGDLAFLLGAGKALLELDAACGGGVLDHGFLAAHATGYPAWAAHVTALPWARLVEGAGVPEATMRGFAETYAAAERTIACWAMGLTQHRHAVATIQELVNLMLLRGNLGRPGAGLCPVRGHSNVQGDRTMGIDWRPPAWLDRLGEVIGFAPPPSPGLDAVETVRAMGEGRVRGLVCLGGNLVAAMSDTAVVAEAVERCRLTVSISTKLNRTHLHPGEVALILPCLGRSEVDVQAGGPQFVTVEDSMSCVHRSQGVLPPASPALRSEPAIVAGLGRALCGEALDWDGLVADYARIRDLIAEVVPGFARYDERVRDPAGFVLPSAARARDFTAVGGRARLTVSEPPDLALPPGHLRMMTIRSHDQYNTTVYGLDDRYRGVRGERRVLLIGQDDVDALGLQARQVVDLIGTWPGRERIARRFIVVPHQLPRGDCATYFPEANLLVPLDSTAEKSNTPTSKSVVIRVVPAGEPPA
jgi:molybdopterin-dependent oxidoreductase alpha subunit